jgi:hypothetical protein
VAAVDGTGELGGGDDAVDEVIELSRRGRAGVAEFGEPGDASEEGREMVPNEVGTGLQRDDVDAGVGLDEPVIVDVAIRSVLAMCTSEGQLEALCT